MGIKILHFYPELMSLYGEYANLAVLRRYLEGLGVEVSVQPVTFEDVPDFAGVDLVYMGAGTERSQKAVLNDMARYAAAFRAAVEQGMLVLFTGSAMETLGASVTDVKGQVWPGLGLAPYTTVESERRTPHDVIACTNLWEEPVVGFMNKCSVTAGVETPLFTTLPMGMGNDARGGAEGYAAGSVLATHLTGPVLVKNPAFLRYVARRLLEAAGISREEPANLPAWLIHEEQAYRVTYAELSAQLGK